MYTFWTNISGSTIQILFAFEKVQNLRHGQWSHLVSECCLDICFIAMWKPVKSRIWRPCGLGSHHITGIQQSFLYGDREQKMIELINNRYYVHTWLAKQHHHPAFENPSFPNATWSWSATPSLSVYWFAHFPTVHRLIGVCPACNSYRFEIPRSSFQWATWLTLRNSSHRRNAAWEGVMTASKLRWSTCLPRRWYKRMYVRRGRLDHWRARSSGKRWPFAECKWSYLWSIFSIMRKSIVLSWRKLTLSQSERQVWVQPWSQSRHEACTVSATVGVPS